MWSLRFRHLLVLAVLFVALRAWAGGLENFAPCVKSNDCKSRQCFEKRCSPTAMWNGHGALGSECTNDSNCASRKCKARRCVAAPTPKATSTPSGRANPIDEEEPEPELVHSACSKKLAEDMFSDFPEIAIEICDRYDDETIARARKLKDANYGAGFSPTCRAIAGRSDAEVECGKRAFDKIPKDDRENEPFKIPVSCVTKQTPEELSRCTKDLLASVGPALRKGKKEADAAYACATYDAKTLETAKKVAAEGYGSHFLLLCRMVDGRTKEELACARKMFASMFGEEERGDYEITMYPECEAPVRKRK